MTPDLDFNLDWRFNLGDTSAACESQYDDSHWRKLRLPHDWSIEAPYDPALEGATGYLPGGVGWYRKHFDLEPDGHKFFIYFDGVYNNTTVWLNGHKLGFHPYGYTPFYFDVTPYLGRENVLAVRVNHSHYADSRWYTGSGIFRKVRLIHKHQVYVPIWGSFVTTPKVKKAEAVVKLELTAKNSSDEPVEVSLITTYLTAEGDSVARAETVLTLGVNNEQHLSQEVSVIEPALWSPDNPHLYKAVTQLIRSGEVLDVHETPFGIRSFAFTADKGFFLNGEHTLIKGVCLHHDAGLVGAAVPDAVWRRRLETLKECGCNAVRTAHNPASEAFLRLCDELGLLVQEEFFDDWDYPKDKRLNKKEVTPDPLTDSYTRHFQDLAQHDLSLTLLRDRNHPCIVQWSIGNEIEWTYERYSDATGYFNPSWQGSYFFELPPNEPAEIKRRFFAAPEEGYALAATAHKLSRWTRALDATRPVVTNSIFPSVSHLSGYADAVDVMGYSYRRVLYDYAHDLYPDKPIMGTENLGQWHEWKAVIERPFIAGTFLWTGIDYLGEAHGKWPQKSLGTGLLDLAGFEKPSFYMFKSLWTDAPTVHLCTQVLDKSLYTLGADGAVVAKNPTAWQQALWVWQAVNEHWNYREGELIAAEVYSNCEALELRLNGDSLGTKHLSDFDDHIYKWIVPFRAGTLTAVSKEGNQYSLYTAGVPTRIQLAIDKPTLEADAYDCVHITAQLFDEADNPVRHWEETVQFEVQGDCRVLGVDNGDNVSVREHQSLRLSTYKGRALLILQANTRANNLRIGATTAGDKVLRSNILGIDVRLPNESYVEVTL